MRIGLGVLGLLLGSSAAVAAPAPPAGLAEPPANAAHYIIESTGGRHGESWMWTTADGVRMGRERMNLRGQVWDLESAAVAGADGLPTRVAIRGVTPQGDATESFGLEGGKASWTSPVDKGATTDAASRFYTPFGGPADLNAWFVERLLAAPGRRLKLLPGGEAHASRLTSLEIGQGAARKTVVLWRVDGLANTPVPIWADQEGRFFGITVGLDWLPEAYAGEMKALETAQAAALAKEGPALVSKVVKTPSTPVAFTHVRLFDADHLAFRNDQTVVVEGGKITAVGPAAKVRYPKASQVVDGHGKTLLPGLWDCHMHVGDDFTGPQELSLGVTSVRDPGNNDELTLDRAKRAAAGQLLAPHVYPSSLIDGKGPYTAQVANVATSKAEALDLVRKAKAKGFIGVKFYGTFDPAWLPDAIAEAHRLGLHVHGHIPHGIRPSEAVRDGYDEITHINWIAMEAVPAEVLPTDNGIARFEAPGRYAKDMDLNGKALDGLVKTMAKRHVYSDPTMVAFEALYVPENGELSPAYAPFVGTLPPTVERGFRAGGFAVPKDLSRADYRKSWAKMVGLLAKMHKAGVPIVAGTDGSGIEIVHELEIYREAGFTPAEALAAATIVPAKLVGQGARTGSIKVGKAADLVLVEGDPEQRIADVRQTRLVMLDGKLMDADALREAVGIAGRPK